MVYQKRTVEPTQIFGANKKTIDKARILRKQMTKAETILWSRLRKKQLLGKYFRKQHPLSCYIVDFYCHECILVIELDGEIHKFQKDYDHERTKDLESFGLKVLRFPNDAVFNDIENVLIKIKEYLKI